MFSNNLCTGSFRTFFISLACTFVLASVAQAHEYQSGDIQIEHPFARATVAGQVSGGAYLGLENKGKTNDALVKAESTIANSVELHQMEMTADHVMKMRQVKEIALIAGKKLQMKPGGGYHIMLTGLNQQLKAGDKFPLTLYFEKAGKIKVMVHVEAANAVVDHQH